MLIRFEVQNFRSIAEPIELSMVAVDRDRPEARDQPNIGESLLPIAAIFGPNASGKSNVIAAFSWLREAVSSSWRVWEDEIPVDPFSFGIGPALPTCFQVEFIIEGVRFEYLLELNGKQVIHEALFHYPRKRARRIFEREGLTLELQRGLGGLSGTRELLTDQTLVLSVARRFGEPLIDQFARKLLQTAILNQTAHRGFFSRAARWRAAGSRPSIELFESREQLSLFDGTEDPPLPDRHSELREQALALLKMADFGIDDVIIERETIILADGRESESRRVRLVHNASGERAPFDFRNESEGTRTWFNLIAPVLTALNTGSILLFDELDASLHPTLSAHVLRLFGSPVTNPLGAQLIFTSHDTSLLNHLNRDEVWLTTKRGNGSTRLGALAEFAGERVRRSQNLESAYLHGRFGALPEVDQTDFLRALGLIG